jgi:hypothetical protein
MKNNSRNGPVELYFARFTRLKIVAFLSNRGPRGLFLSIHFCAFCAVASAQLIDTPSISPVVFQNFLTWLATCRTGA